jgi:SAM-dependent methyltransferase
MAGGHARIAVSGESAELLERAAAEAFEAGALGAEEREGAPPALWVYARAGDAARVHAALGAVPGLALAAPEPVPERAWSEAWKEGLEPIVISPRLLVRPPFRSPPAGFAGAELVIDPGQAFGTGAHASTRLALEAIDALPEAALRGARVLDVGCGGGRYLEHLRRRGFAAEGTEVDAALAEQLRREHGFVVHAGELEELPLEEHAYDAVTLWWVLEHTHDPLRTLRAAERLLRPGGLAVASVQNFESLGRRVFGRFWQHLDLPGHLQHFEAVRIRHDAIAKDFAPSIGLALGAGASFDRTPLNLLALPFDALAWALRRSGLITAYARRPPA